MSERFRAPFDTDWEQNPVRHELILANPGIEQACLVEEANPGVNIGSSTDPTMCKVCHTSGYINEGIYFTKDSTRNCPYTSRLPAAERLMLELRSLDDFSEFYPTPRTRTEHNLS